MTTELFSQIRLPAKLEYLGIFIASVKAAAEKYGFAMTRISEIELATEEILVNIFNYAYQNAETGCVRVITGTDEDRRFVIEISDTGIPFNMLQADPPDLTSDISLRKIGGLGVFLARELINDISYFREDNRNILKIRV
jgi:serine/threonine-protein kinase RsbW